MKKRSRRPQHTEVLERRTLLSGSSDAVGGSYTAPADPRATLDLGTGWKFIRSDVSGAQATSFNDSSWSTVSLPHTWNAQDGQDGGTNGKPNYYQGIGWYRKSVTVPSSMIGDTIHVRFDGASIATTLYVDGQQIGSHRGSFSSFDFDLTSNLSGGGTHTFAVKVDNSAALQFEVAPQSGDFNMAGGLYRDVSLLGVNAQHVSIDDFASSGVYFSSPTASSTSANISVRTGLSNESTASRNLIVHTLLVDKSGTVVADQSTTKTLAAGADDSVTQSATVANPHLWNGVLDPYLHDLYVEVRDASTNELVDLVHQRVGIRTYQITPQGFFLNGKAYDVHGVSIHQDRQDEGWAISDADIRQDMDLVSEIGATGLRTAHYEMNQLVYDLADEKGLIVYTEIPNVGSNSGGTIPQSATFLANAQQQLKELIRQRYNHPSIVVWGVFNEVANTTENQTFVQNLSALAHAEDPTRLTAGASNGYFLNPLERSTDVANYNRYYGWYYGQVSEFATQLDMLHTSTPLMPVGITEYGAGGSITQHAENPKNIINDGPFHPEEYQSIYHEQTWKIIEARPWIWGKFVWNLFDFAADYRDEGDTPGRNDKGLITYDRKTKKDAFYFYKANWSTAPVLYVTGRHWADRTDAATKIKVYSNLANPTLKLNGVSVSLTNAGDNVWTTATVNLAPGNNSVAVVGTRNGTTYTDNVTWTLPGTTPPSDSTIRVNFQPATGATPANYFADTGLTFGTRAGTTQYGWNADNSANTRRRGVNADVRLDTFIHMALGGTYSWEYALPNGTYDVTIGAGDASYTDSLNDLKVESTVVKDTDGQDNYDTLKTRVTVSDGRLTIAQASTGVNAKLQYIDITPVVGGTAPAAPTSLVASATTTSSITLGWTDNATDETGFQIERKNADGTWTQIGTTNAGVTTFAVTALASGTSYSFRVRAANATGPSGYSNELTATTQQPVVVLPSAPTNFAAIAVDANSIRLTWTDVPSETGFRIERRIGTGAWTPVTTVAANTTQYLDTNLSPNTTYSYQIFATNSAGSSSASIAATATTPVADAYTSADIGGPTAAGTTKIVTPGTDYDITAGGTDVWGTADQFRFVYKTITGDFDYSARIADVAQTDIGSMAGLMARSSLAANAAHLFMRARVQGLRANYRLTNGGDSVGVGGITFTYPNAYVRLQRSGNIFTAYGSTDGVNWTLVTQQTMTTMPATLYLGIAVSARTTTNATTLAKVRELTDRTSLPTAPAAPTNLAAVVDAVAKSVALSWTDRATNENGYRVERRLAASNTWGTLTTLAADATGFTDTTAAYDTAYAYRVFATSAAGDSAPSNEVNATIATPVTAPAAPSALIALSAANGVSLAWTDNASTETGFRVERQTGDTGAWAAIATLGADASQYLDASASPATTYNYRVVATNSAGDSAASNTVTVTTATVDSAFTSVDVGSPVTPGSTTTITPGIDYDITAGGTDVWANSDQFRFAYKSVNGDFDYSARIAGLDQADIGSMAGLMARASLAADAPHLYMRARAEGLRANYRSTIGGPTTGVGAIPFTYPNAYVRLQRVGSVFTAYGSTDGVNWTLVTQQTIVMPQSILLGMAVSARTTTAATATGHIREFTDRSTLPTGPTLPAAPTNLAGVADATPSVHLTWNDNSTDEGGFRVERRLAGGTAWTSVATLGAAATDYLDTSVVAGTSYVYRVFATNAAGDSAPTAELAIAIAPTASPVPNAPTALASSNVTGGVKLNWADNSTNELNFQIERRPAGIAAWNSLAIVAANVTTFTDVTATAGTAYVYRVRALGAAADSDYSNESSITTPAAASFSSADIGTTGGATTAVGSNGYDITAGGADIWNATDHFRFVYRQVSGNFDLKVRVANLSVADIQSMAGLMARATLDANSRNVLMKVSANTKDRMTYRSATGGLSTGVGSGTSSFPNAWLRLTRSGNTFTGSMSVNGVTWTTISSVTLALPTTLYVGLAASSHTTAGTTVAQFRDLTLA